VSPADQADSEFDEAEVDVGAVLPADREAFELVEPCEGALDDPADRPKAGPVCDAAAGEDRSDPSLAKEATVLVVVVASVGVDRGRSVAGPAGLAADRWDGVEQWEELGDVVAVAAGDRDGQRDAVAAGQQVMLGTWPASVDRRRSDSLTGIPLFARTWDPSTAARAQSI
jgi:hypothetical protein